MPRILIIDDEENIRHSLKAALERRGHEIVTAKDFREGAEFATAGFDLIFLDPPYAQELAERALVEVAKRGLLSAKGILCVETGADEVLPATVCQLQRIDQRRYGITMINFYINVSKD